MDIFLTSTIIGCKSERNAPEKHLEKRSGGINALFAPRKSDHQHYPPLRLDESVRVAHHNGINLR